MRRVTSWMVATAMTLPAAAAAGSGALPSPAAAQERSARPDSTAVYLLDGLNVTALRGVRPVYRTPAPVSVLPGRLLRAGMVANVADAFRALPGLDAEGVGPAQRRPVIRGMRGQRVLLLEDGLRLNNARRRVDSGEPTGLVPVGDVQRLEVVRGPASVLYGSDAVGGVVNLVTARAPAGDDGTHGELSLGARTAGTSSNLTGVVRSGGASWGLRVSGSLRAADPYEAPAGSFGSVRLSGPRRVNDSGGRERSLRVEARLVPSSRLDLFARVEGYASRDTGFGWLDPEVFGPGSPTTRLWYPEQDFRRFVVGYDGVELRTAVADALTVRAYAQSNRRQFFTDVRVPSPAPGVPEVRVHSENVTDLSSEGLRVEARRLLRRGLLLTYGLDAYRDRSEGTDTSTTTLTGAGPDIVRGRAGPQVPRARLVNAGIFAQGSLSLPSDGEVVAGIRLQDVRSRSLETPGNATPASRYHDRTLVGSFSVLQPVAAGVSVVASVSRGFRTPNLVERFFTGLTANGRGFWLANPELGPETALNLDVGVRLRRGGVQAEAFAFRNRLADGIVLEPTGEKEGRATVYRNVNVEDLRYRGVEAAAEVRFGKGWRVRADGTWLDVKDARDPGRVLAETYPSRVGAEVGYERPERFGVAWSVRRNGTREVVEGTTPVGDVIPSFTVHAVRGWWRIAPGLELRAGVENVGNVLYAEALNSGFFRPEPGRHLTAAVAVRF